MRCESELNALKCRDSAREILIKSRYRRRCSRPFLGVRLSSEQG